MKSIIFSLLAVVAIQGSAFAADTCNDDISAKALELARQEGLGKCQVGEIRPWETLVAIDGEQGQVELNCLHNISQMSVVRRVVTFNYQVPSYENFKALNCGEASVIDPNAQ